MLLNYGGMRDRRGLTYLRRVAGLPEWEKVTLDDLLRRGALVAIRVVHHCSECEIVCQLTEEGAGSGVELHPSQLLYEGRHGDVVGSCPEHVCRAVA